MYFIILGLINRPNILIYFAIVIIITAGYYVYWANDNYLANNWAMFTQGRLRGPRFSPYADGNALSIVLIIGMPFILFGIQFFKRQWVKISLLLLIPLLWHALILFASRGALLSAAVVTLYAAMIMKSKVLNKILVLGFIAALITQGGVLMQRTTSTIEKSESQTEEPLNPRIVSWTVGVHLAMKYPFLGVGPQRFQKASATLFPGESPHVAHNTLLNFSANTGIFAGLLYLSFFYTSWKQYKYVRNNVAFTSVYSYINRSSMTALIGFFVGAIFLDLIIFEPFYFILVLISSNFVLVKQEQLKNQPNE
jgi:ABC-type multidrug transport system fused ATPase/permease subunit